MKTTNKNLDDIIFEKRNKDYGAYKMRKSYNNNMMKALIIAIVLFLMGISVPLIANYINGKNRNLTTVVTIGGDVFKKPPALKPDLPKIPVEIKKVIKFKVPIVTVNSSEVDDIDIGDLKDKAFNPNIDTTGGIMDIKEDTPPNRIIDEGDELKIHTFVEEWPEFPGGDAGRIKFLSENIKYPQVAKETGIQGPVFLTFVIERDGNVSNVALIRGIGGGCDEEAIRVVNNMPRWKPGRQNGKEVRVQFNMPIAFTLK
ncbi:MAG: energy transducer TonB [Bacteroidota bacterium]